MALDLYAGGFARYFARDWENVMQRYCRETGTQYNRIGPGGIPPPANWDEVKEAVGHWIAVINRGLGSHLAVPITWSEERDAPYFTDRPGYEGLGGLSLWAAYAEIEKIPPEAFPEEWIGDQVYQAAVENKDPTRKSLRVIHSVQLWLPADFKFSFEFKSLTGEQTQISSTGALIESLEALNQRTFAMNDAEKAEALKGGYAEQSRLEEVARFGFAIFEDLARKAHRHQLPLFFDQ